MVHALLGIVELFLACIPVYYVLVGIDKMLLYISARLILTAYDVADLLKAMKERAGIK